MPKGLKREVVREVSSACFTSRLVLPVDVAFGSIFWGRLIGNWELRSRIEARLNLDAISGKRLDLDREHVMVVGEG